MRGLTIDPGTDGHSNPHLNPTQRIVFTICNKFKVITISEIICSHMHCFPWASGVARNLTWTSAPLSYMGQHCKGQEGRCEVTLLTAHLAVLPAEEANVYLATSLLLAPLTLLEPLCGNCDGIQYTVAGSNAAAVTLPCP